MRKVMTGALCLVLCAAVAFGAGTAEFGPRKNAEDQFRFFWLLPEDIYGDLVHSGFNLFVIRNYGVRIVRGDGVTYGVSATAVKQRIMDWVLADGLDYIEQLSVANNKRVRALFPRKLRDGSDWDRNVDAGDPKAHELMLKAAEVIAHSVSNHPACIGVQPSTEIRDRSRPSFRPYLAETYRRDTGADLPPEVTERLAPHYTQIGDFPESRIVPLDYRLMKFYTWFWKKGDGWNGFQDDVVRLFRKEMGRPLVSFYDPVVRTPPLWGSGGTELTWGNQWTYSYPEPYNIAFVIAEQQAMSRGVAGMGVISMAQGIVKRIHLAPKTEKPENEPGWLKAQADCDYFTTPPDMMREAIWSMFAKRMDGVGIFACRALFDLSKVEKSNGYAFTNPETMPVISNLFTTVGRELGPLFRAIPEREPTVAYLESYASAFFAHHASWGWDGPIYDCGVMATAAQLNPYVLYEEEIATRGIPPTVKVVIARLCEVLAEPTYEALLAFQGRGGVIVADEKLPPGILPDYDFPAFGRPNLRGTAEDKKGLVRAAMELKDIAKRHVKLPADTENPDIVLMTRTSGDADYVFAINDRREYGDYVGKAWKRVMEKGLPNSGTVVLSRKAGAVYDLVAHRALPIRAKDGMTEVDVAYENTDGKVLMVVTKPLGRLKIHREGASVVVTSSDRDVLIPIEVTADGREPRFGIVTDGVWKRPYKAGANLRVRNLADGKTYAVGTGSVPELGSVPETPAVLRVGPTTRPFVRTAVESKPKVEMPYRDNRAWSQSEQNDHATVSVESVPQRGGRFQFSQPVKRHEVVELWFGKRKRDLYVWLNGVYLGQFVAAKQAGQEFRLDATKEAKLDGVNKVVVKGTDGEVIHTKFTAELLTWRSH